MSKKISVKFEIRNMAIMKSTLNQLGMEFSEIGEDQVQIQRFHNNIIINSSTGQISFDSDSRHEVDNIKQSYQVSWYKDRAVREGMQLKEERKANGEVVLTVSHS